MTESPSNRMNRRLRGTAALCAVFVAAMLGAAYAAVPLYEMFCRATGYGGTPQIASAAPAEQGSRRITVRLDANVAPGLDWEFRPEQRAVEVAVGQSVLVNYRVTNRSERTSAGTATYNVTPERTGTYFAKLQCFCFERQELKAGETIDMPVVFFIDPLLDDERELKKLNTITLSYTFFAAKPAEPVAQIGAAGSKL